MKNKNVRGLSTKVKLLGAGLLVSIPVLAVGGGGGGLSTGAYIGELPEAWFQDEPCHNGVITIYEDTFLLEYQIDVSGVASDGDPNTYLKCTAQANLQTLTCNAGLSDGTVIGCRDIAGPHLLPAPGNVVYMQYDPVSTAPCNILIGTGNEFGTADPKCRTGGDGDGDGSGGSTGSPCNASTAAATLTTGQTTNIASNACVRLKNEAGWSTIDPQLQALPGTAAYPVPFSYSSCDASGSGSLTGDWFTAYVGDGQAGPESNPGCDIFLQLEGSGSQVSFAYYE